MLAQGRWVRATPINAPRRRHRVRVTATAAAVVSLASLAASGAQAQAELGRPGIAPGRDAPAGGLLPERARRGMSAASASVLPASEQPEAAASPAVAIAHPMDPVTTLWARPTSGWTATEEYLDGTYVWTDQVFDDRGAGGEPYPAEAEPYMQNAADLVEVRLRPAAGRKLVVGARLNTLLDPNVPIVSVGLVDPGSDGVKVAWPGSAVQAEGVRWVVTLANGNVSVSDLTSGTSTGTDAPTIHHDTDAEHRALENTITAVVPLDAIGIRNPPATLAVYAVAGVHDPETGGWFGQPATYDVAFFTGETFSDWERTEQSALIEDGDITETRGTVDFSVAHRPARPKLGQAQTRIYRPSIEMQIGEGIAPNEAPLVTGAEDQLTLTQGNRYLGLFVPYAVWVPPNLDRLDKPVPLFLQLHGLSQNHLSLVSNWTSGAVNVPAIAVFPLGHGEAGYYQGPSELDVLESLEDAERHYPVDEDRVHLSGLSMGGIGTYTVGAHRPDLFAAAIPVVGPGSGFKDFLWPAPLDPVMGPAREYVHLYRLGSFGREVLDNALNLPFRIFGGALDPLTLVTFNEGDAAKWEELGYDYQYALFLTRSHEFFSPYVNTLYHQVLNGCASAGVPGCDATLDPGGRVRDENPARVVYKAVPFHWHPRLSDKLVFDGAYWVSGMQLREQPFADSFGRIAVTSRALADKLGEPAEKLGPEVRTFQPSGDRYKFQGRRWKSGALGQDVNGFDVMLHNLSAATLDTERMQLDVHHAIAMKATGDGSTDLSLVGEWRDGTVVRVLRDGEQVASGTASNGVVTIHDLELGDTADYVITAS